MSDHTVDWGSTRGLFTILFYDFKAPNGLLMSPTLWPLVFRFETYDLIIRGAHNKHTIGWVDFRTGLFGRTSVREAWCTGKDPAVPLAL